MASSSSSSNSTGATERSMLQRKSTDVGWEFGILVNPHNLDKVKCKLCGKEFSGGVYRLKQHIGRLKGNVSACPSSTPEQQEKCKLAILGAQNKRKRAQMGALDIRNPAGIGEQRGEEDFETVGMENNKPRMIGPMDRFVTSINQDSPSGVGMTTKQRNVHDALAKKRLKRVHEYIARWIYTHGVSFNVIDNDEFKMMLEAVGQYGTGVTPPSQYQLREPLLRGEVERIKGLLKEQEEEWKPIGYSIMIDAWTDRKKRSIMNLFVNGGKGTLFLSSKVCSNEAFMGQFIFEHVNEHIEKVGVDKVVQVVTVNGTNNIVAAKLLKEVMPSIFWTSCAAHTMNLMMESIAKLNKFKETIEKAKALTNFVYAHRKTLSMMRMYTKKRDIVRPGVTRFVSTYLTLQSLDDEKEQLKMLFVSKEWEDCKWSAHPKGKMAFTTVTSFGFWNDVSTCLKVFAPLVRVLRLVDGDKKSTMGFLYGELKEAKKKICEAYNDLEMNYGPIIGIIDEMIKGRLDSPLHLAAYLLNPYYTYKDYAIQLDGNLLDAIIKCAEAFFPNDLDAQKNVVNFELQKYQSKEGYFGKPYAIKGCEENDGNYDPVQWWCTYGISVPKLQKVAIKILSLATSLSGCLRSRNNFEGVHTKRRNRLDTKRLDNLLYVQFNARFMAQRKKQKDEDADILLANDAYHVQDWIAEGVQSGDRSREELQANEGLRDEEDNSLARAVRELHEPDFESEEEEEIDFDFESDEEHTLKDYELVELDD